MKLVLSLSEATTYLKNDAAERMYDSLSQIITASEDLKIGMRKDAEPVLAIEEAFRELDSAFDVFCIDVIDSILEESKEFAESLKGGPNEVLAECSVKAWEGKVQEVRALLDNSIEKVTDIGCWMEDELPTITDLSISMVRQLDLTVYNHANTLPDEICIEVPVIAD